MEQHCRTPSFRGQWHGAVQLMGAGSTKLQPGRAPGVKPLHEGWFSMYLHVSALFQVMRAQLRYAHGLECFPKGSPVEKKWNSSGQIPLSQILMAKSDPPVVKGALGPTQCSSPCCLPPPTAATYSGCHTTSCSTVKRQISKTLPQNKAWGSARACGQGAPSSQMRGRAHPPVPGDAQGWLDRKQTRRGKSKRSSSELFNTSLYCLCF